MIQCKQLLDFCFEYLEGTLPLDQRSRFERHLSGCHACVSFFETYRRTPELTREALAVQMPDSVRDAIRSFLRKTCGDDESH